MGKRILLGLEISVVFFFFDIYTFNPLVLESVTFLLWLECKVCGGGGYVVVLFWCGFVREYVVKG